MLVFVIFERNINESRPYNYENRTSEFIKPAFNSVKTCMYNAIPITHDFNPVHVLQSYLIVEKASDYQKINWPFSICNN